MQRMILAALEQELAPLRRSLESSDVRLVRTGVGPVRAEQAARNHCAHAELIVSTGCCGGLDEEAATGSLIIPARVLTQEGGDAPAPDPSWHRRALEVAGQQGLTFATGPLITVSRALHTPQSKRDCHRRSGAVAVDMETAAIARVAGEMGIPYLSIRVVLDTVNEALPVIELTGDKGRLRPVDLVRMARRPQDLLTLGKLALRWREVSSSLARCIEGLLEK